jgi:two-component system chemotaxis response regulator CheB
MQKIRVLVVDDSVVMRRLLSDALSQDPAIEIAGTAANGRIALQKLPQINPDVLTLDIEMPEMDGLETLVEVRKTYTKLPIVMFSTLTERGAVATLDALARGATDYVAKPANVGSLTAGLQSVRDQLIPKIKVLCPRIQSPVNATIATATKNTTSPSHFCSQRRDVVVIGSSTGGPSALAAVLKELPANFPLPIVIVQHMPPIFTQHLAARLNQECALTVKEAATGDLLQPGRVLIAPGDFHVELVRHGVDVKTILHQGPHENSCRPAVDVLFRSAASTYGANCLGVVLTGMGQDGLLGARQMVQMGGDVIAQNEESSVVWGMPRAVVEAGLARKAFPLCLIAGELTRSAAFGRRPSLVPTGVT